MCSIGTFVKKAMGDSASGTAADARAHQAPSEDQQEQQARVDEEEFHPALSERAIALEVELDSEIVPRSPMRLYLMLDPWARASLIIMSVRN